MNKYYIVREGDHILKVLTIHQNKKINKKTKKKKKEEVLARFMNPIHSPEKP